MASEEAEAEQPSRQGKACHAGIIRGEPCRVEPNSWRRVCQRCLVATQDGLECPANRLRLVVDGVGEFTTGRNFYVSWTTPFGTIHNVKPFRVGELPGTVVLFADAKAAEEVDSWPWVSPLPASLVPVCIGDWEEAACGDGYNGT